ncbi:MAG: hypothetical protein VYE69_07225 [Pseudomonadota bacterium]|nr:hypothetical protein [Pseudomonadota bacterium]
MKKRHKHYLMGFLLAFLIATCIMVHAIYARDLEPNFTRLFVFPVLMGGLIALAVWQSKEWERIRRREREDFRKRGWNYKAYKRTLFVFAVLLACALVIYEIWT